MPPKRKSDASSTSDAKKSRTTGTIPAAPVSAEMTGLMNAILSDPTGYPIPDSDEEVRATYVNLAQYARNLEFHIGQLNTALSQAQAATAAGGGGGGKQMTAEQIGVAAEKLRKAAVSGIQKLMSNWKPSCKTGSAKFVYDGVCADPNIFGAFMGLNGPPTWKQKFTPDEFEDIFGEIAGKVRYAELVLTSNVNVRWIADDGIFKISGSYGVHGSGATRST
ncbi:hypothetical protein C8Q75DRAFT_888126 [Abortiporus biennis]|nr:hypothetical protein C8Q75DRAFT_888126 [Abortiporus biennis]